MAEGSSLEEIVEYFRLHPEALGAKELSPRAVRVVETHISYILLDGVHAYKFKKPQDYGFLNFSTLELRKKYCLLENELNSKISQGIYLGVVAVIRDQNSASSFHLIDLDSVDEKRSSTIVEYAVKMNEFDSSQEFIRLHERGDLEPKHIHDLAKILAATHSRAEVHREDSYGSTDVVYAAAIQNFDQIDEILCSNGSPEELQSRELLASLRKWSETEFSNIRDKLERRKSDGFVKCCHGDLHLGNIALIHGRPTLFDCIEFNDSLRIIDTTSDLAFLLMDLDDHGEQGLSTTLLNTYISSSGDFSLLDVLQFFKIFRAMVRAKVELMTSRSAHSDSQRSRSSAGYFNYLQLAQSYLTISPPFLLLMCGVSGSGKSHVASLLSQQLRAIHLRSDVERKRLFGLSELDHSRDLGIDIYSADATRATFQRLASLALSALTAGFPVLVDATFLRADVRATFSTLASSISVPLLLIRCLARKPVLLARLRDRRSDASEADCRVLEAQLHSEDPLSDTEAARLLELDTSDGFDESDAAALSRDVLRRLGLGPCPQSSLRRSAECVDLSGLEGGLRVVHGGEELFAVPPLSRSSSHRLLSELSQFRTVLELSQFQEFLLLSYALRWRLLSAEDQPEDEPVAVQDAVVVAADSEELVNKFVEQLWTPEEPRRVLVTEEETELERQLEDLADAEIGAMLVYVDEQDVRGIQEAIQRGGEGDCSCRLKKRCAAWKSMEKRFKDKAFCILVKDENMDRLLGLHSEIPATCLPSYEFGHLVLWHKNAPAEVDISKVAQKVESNLPYSWPSDILCSQSQWKKMVLEAQLKEVLRLAREHSQGNKKMTQILEEPKNLPQLITGAMRAIKKS